MLYCGILFKNLFNFSKIPFIGYLDLEEKDLVLLSLV